MHTILVILGGFVLLAVTYGLTLVTGWTYRSLLPIYLALWLVCALINMWIGVAHAGYSVKEEFPILIVIFIVPALAAILLSYKS